MAAPQSQMTWWRRRAEVIWRRTPQHVVALPAGREALVLSGAACELWELLETERSAADLVRALGPGCEGIARQLERSGLLRITAQRSPDSGASGVAASGGRVFEPPTSLRFARAGRAPSLAAEAVTFWLSGGVPPVVEAPLSGERWSAVVNRAREQRCLGPFTWAVASGALPSTEEQRDEVDRLALLLARRAVALEAELRDVWGLLSSAGVELRVLKGSATAHLDHVDPSFRTASDLDLLVRSGDIDAAAALLAEAGYGRDLPERRRRYDVRFGKDITFRLEGRHEVDLHRLPLAGPFGLAVDLDLLWERRSTFGIGGSELVALDATARFVHACWSLALTDPRPRLLPALDMVVIAVRHEIDWDGILALCPPRRGLAAVVAAIRTCEGLLGGRFEGVPAEIAQCSTPWLERLLLLGYPGQGGSNSLSLMLGALLQGTVRERADHVASLVWPGREYRTARAAQGRRPEWRVAAAELRAARRSSA